MNVVGQLRTQYQAAFGVRLALSLFDKADVLGLSRGPHYSISDPFTPPARRALSEQAFKHLFHPALLFAMKSVICESAENLPASLIGNYERKRKAV